MAMIKRFEDIQAWQEARKLVQKPFNPSTIKPKKPKP
jgi:hypothetical protein